jgi:hypothetical protein
MTYPDDLLAGLDATPEERRALDEALADVEWDEAVAASEAGEDGPWHDQAGGYGGDDQARLAAVGETVDDSYGRAAAVAAEDDEDEQWYARRPSGEDKLARAMGRIGRDSYTPPAYFRAAPDARDPLGRYAAACGALDDYGRCASRFHAAGCHVITDEAASTSTAEAVEAWNDTLAGHTLPPGVDAEALGLASPSTPEPWGVADAWSDLLSSGEPGDSSRLRAWTLHQMGEADQPAPEPGPAAPTSARSGPLWVSDQLE